ncbi:ABC-2 type transporter [Popillia japonica]|uniref:ABC-2 type transporter n=1 Tax=Popillia japonica TaxID=7064 RepID=A0AAW1IYU7_POPJA
MGSSGAGKTSLLNVLAGFIKNGVTGEINVNGQPRDMQEFKKISTYIMQHDVLERQLSVLELMSLVANLRLSSHLYSKTEKMKIVNTILQVMGLQQSLNTRTECLSGGQTKRLAISLALIDNPPIMFLDEPTTGLDNFSAKQCIELLKTLANQGRTIICTIHQPSNLLCTSFDQVYFMSEGYCIYNGSLVKMIPFLEDLRFSCPTFSSPTDYIIEISSDSNNTEILSKAVENGLLTVKNPVITKTSIYEKQYSFVSIFNRKPNTTKEDFPISYYTQVGILLKKMFLQMCRNKIALTIQFSHHIISGLSLGVIFFNTGNDASQSLATFKFFVSLMVFYLYTYIISPILLFPFELEIIKRQYFNRWYSLKAYYTALTLFNIPHLVSFSLIFNVIIYISTGQPLEAHRFFFFNVVCILTGLTAYGIGITLGSICSPTVGACAGSTLAAYLIIITTYGMGVRNAVPIFAKILMMTAFPRHGVIGLCTATLQGRPLMDCDQLFCFIRDPEDLLDLMGMKDANIYWTTAALIGFLVLYRIAAFIALKWKLSQEF